jgi:hypothetical protein
MAGALEESRARGWGWRKECTGEEDVDAVAHAERHRHDAVRA